MPFCWFAHRDAMDNQPSAGHRQQRIPHRCRGAGILALQERVNGLSQLAAGLANRTEHREASFAPECGSPAGERDADCLTHEPIGLIDESISQRRLVQPFG
jgi:hypothetical protein